MGLEASIQLEAAITSEPEENEDINSTGFDQDVAGKMKRLHGVEYFVAVSESQKEHSTTARSI